MTPSELEIENSHNQEWSGTSTKFCILSLQLCFWNNGREIKWNTRFLLLLFWANAFEQGTVSHGINSCDEWFFPEVIILRYPCANLCASNENQSSIYRQLPIGKKQLWNNKEQIHSDQNNVIRYGNSVGLVWEKVFVSVFRVKLTTRACCCDKVLWQFKSNPIAVLS